MNVSPSRLIVAGAPVVEVEFITAAGARVSMAFGSPACAAEGMKDLDRAYRKSLVAPAHDPEIEAPR